MKRHLMLYTLIIILLCLICDIQLRILQDPEGFSALYSTARKEFVKERIPTQLFFMVNARVLPPYYKAYYCYSGFAWVAACLLAVH